MLTLVKINRFKHSGLANSKAIDLTADGKDITLSLKTTKSNSPKNSQATTKVNQHFRKSSHVRRRAKPVED